MHTGCIIFTTPTVGYLLIFTHLKFFLKNRCIIDLTMESISDFILSIFSISLVILLISHNSNILDFEPIFVNKYRKTTK